VETRTRILEAARGLLSGSGPISFSVDAVAERADVARMTVYNHFGSRRGLVEALSDELAMRGGMGRLPEAFRASTPEAGLRRLVEVFVGFWDAEQVAIRRLRALTAIDPELTRDNRDLRRRQAIGVLVQRLGDETGAVDVTDLERAVDQIWVLTGFDAYDHLASTGKSADEIVEVLWTGVERLIHK
jgi:AcrR family transcriptional regulator